MLKRDMNMEELTAWRNLNERTQNHIESYVRGAKDEINAGKGNGIAFQNIIHAVLDALWTSEVISLDDCYTLTNYFTID